MKVRTFKSRVGAAIEKFFETKYTLEGVGLDDDLEASGDELGEVLEELADHLVEEFDGETFEAPDDSAE